MSTDHDPTTIDRELVESMQRSFVSLKRYVEGQDYKGWDPYDGLNSRILLAVPYLRRSSLVRLAWIQAVKRSHLNLRPLLLVPKGLNPKALALFVSGYSRAYSHFKNEALLDQAVLLADRLLSVSSTGFAGYCWGYNFDWQARAGFKPAYLPTSVVTSFAGCAFMDLFAATGEERFKDVARSACDFMLQDLNRTKHTDGICFSYSPADQSEVYNASFLVSKLLARVYSITREPELIDAARGSMSYCCKRQSPDGSWEYGTESFQKWVDSFHTGFNLESISVYQRHTQDFDFDSVLKSGFRYYLDSFFTKDGMAKYYHDRLYPIDIHAIAQFLSTVSSIRRFPPDVVQLLEAVTAWSIEEMQDSDGHFYYQKTRNRTTKTSFMRWSQAWMFYGLSSALAAISGNDQ